MEALESWVLALQLHVNSLSAAEHDLRQAGVRHEHAEGGAVSLPQPQPQQQQQQQQMSKLSMRLREVERRMLQHAEGGAVSQQQQQQLQQEKDQQRQLQQQQQQQMGKLSTRLREVERRMLQHAEGGAVSQLSTRLRELERRVHVLEGRCCACDCSDVLALRSHARAHTRSHTQTFLSLSLSLSLSFARGRSPDAPREHDEGKQRQRRPRRARTSSPPPRQLSEPPLGTTGRQEQADAAAAAGEAHGLRDAAADGSCTHVHGGAQIERASADDPGAQAPASPSPGGGGGVEEDEGAGEVEGEVVGGSAEQPLACTPTRTAASVSMQAQPEARTPSRRRPVAQRQVATTAHERGRHKATPTSNTTETKATVTGVVKRGKETPATATPQSKRRGFTAEPGPSSGTSSPPLSRPQPAVNAALLPLPQVDSLHVCKCV